MKTYTSQRFDNKQLIDLELPRLDCRLKLLGNEESEKTQIKKKSTWVGGTKGKREKNWDKPALKNTWNWQKHK